MNTTLAVIVAVIVLALLAAGAWWYFRRSGNSEGEEQTFEGTFTFGWEVSSFVPGDSSASSPRYWLAWTPTSRFMEQFKEQGYDAAWTPGYGRVHVRFVGVLENSGSGYGHMQQYEGQVTVIRVLEMGRAEQVEQ